MLGIGLLCTYNVSIMTYKTKLTTSGNSKAVRLPKQLLMISGLTQHVELVANKGRITIKSVANPRADWAAQIKDAPIKDSKPTTEFADMEAVVYDGLEGLPWDGPSYQEWLHGNEG